MTKNLTALLVLALVWTSAFAQALDQGKIGNIEEIFKLTKVDQYLSLVVAAVAHAR